MPYHFNIDQIHEKMFILQMLAAGSDCYCSTHNLTDEDETDEHFGWYHYYGHLKNIISRVLIETSISCRILDDVLSKNPEYSAVNLNTLLAKSIKNPDLGIVLSGDFELTLRESFNKLVHASDMNLCYDSQVSMSNKSYKYWTGSVDLFGEHKGQEWTLMLHTSVWSQMVQKYILAIETHVDLHHLYKYDY